MAGSIFRTAALLGACLLAFGNTAPAQSADPGYVETVRDADGTFRTTSANGGREGARYQAGSTSKYACALLALDLERAGKLKLDDTLATLLPEYHASDSDRISLRNLLQNRSGIADTLMEELRKDAKTLAAQTYTPIAANLFAMKRTRAVAIGSPAAA